MCKIGLEICINNYNKMRRFQNPVSESMTHAWRLSIAIENNTIDRRKRKPDKGMHARYACSRT